MFARPLVGREKFSCCRQTANRQEHNAKGVARKNAFSLHFTGGFGLCCNLCCLEKIDF